MRVCVTGFGMIDALGNNPEECWNKLIDNNSYYRYNTEVGLSYDKYPLGLFPEPDTYKIPEGLNPKFMPRTMLYGMHAVDQAIEHSGVPKSSNVGVFFSSLTGGNEFSHEMMTSQGRVSPKKGINMTADALCGLISQHYGFEGINTCLYSACATGLVTIDFAMKFVDQYDYVIAGGSDAGINQIDMRLFDSFRAITDNTRPFDKDRSGFMMSEGAGCLILESEEKAKARGAKIYAYLYPAGHASDAFDRTLPQGTGAMKAMKQAIQHKIDYVNAHGTSTPAGDQVEYDAIQEVLPNVPVTSNKGKIGHTFAAAGVLETIYSILSMEHGIIPLTHNCLDTDMDKVVQENTVSEIKRILNNSFGFGGKCISMEIENGNEA